MTSVEARRTPRFTIMKEKDGGLRLVLPPQRDVEVGLFYGVSLVLWGFVEVFVIRQLLFGSPAQPVAFLVAWLIAFTLVGGLTVLAFLWNVIGREVVTLDGETLTIRRAVGRLGWSGAYSRKKMCHLHAASRLPFGPFNGFGANNPQAWGAMNGCIAFHYQYATHRFGAGIDEEEAKHLIAVIRQHGGGFGDGAAVAIQ